jgi:hypothetical protein
MTISFIAVDRGMRADGFLVVGSKVFVARSGGIAGTRGEIPAGTYQLGGPEGLNRGSQQITMTNGQNVSRFRKFAITGTAANREFNKKEGVWGVRDERYPGDSRTGLRFHFDGDVVGSAGCIAYDDPAAQEALTAAHARGDTEVQVVYLENDAAVRQRTQELVGRETPLPENTRPW